MALCGAAKMGVFALCVQLVPVKFENGSNAGNGMDVLSMGEDLWMRKFICVYGVGWCRELLGCIFIEYMVNWIYIENIWSLCEAIEV